MKVESYRENYRDDHSEDDEDDFQGEDVEVDVGSNTVKADMRKSNKPIMEKRRRARINNCLNDLKGILLEAMRKDPARHSKLEKADILELTVRHLQNVQRNQLAIAMATDPTVLHRFKNGFSECATEVGRYMGRLDNVEHGIKQRLTGHLGACVNGLQQVGPVTFGSSPRYSPIGTMPFPVQSRGNTQLQHTIGLGSPPQSLGLNGSQQHQDFNNNSSTTNSSPSSTITSPDSFELTPSRLNFTCTSSAFTPSSSVGTPPPSPPLSYPLTKSSQPLQDGGISSGSMTEKGTNTIPLFNIGGSGPLRNVKASSRPSTGLPLDFSLSATESKLMTEGEGRTLHHNKQSLIQRVGKVEPMKKMEIHQVDPSQKGIRDSMWRPW